MEFDLLLEKDMFYYMFSFSIVIKKKEYINLLVPFLAHHERLVVKGLNLGWSS